MWRGSFGLTYGLVCRLWWAGCGRADAAGSGGGRTPWMPQISWRLVGLLCRPLGGAGPGGARCPQDGSSGWLQGSLSLPWVLVPAGLDELAFRYRASGVGRALGRVAGSVGRASKGQKGSSCRSGAGPGGWGRGCPLLFLRPRFQWRQQLCRGGDLSRKGASGRLIRWAGFRGGRRSLFGRWPNEREPQISWRVLWRWGALPATGGSGSCR